MFKTKITTREIWNIAYPIMFGNMAQTLISITDTAFLGRLSTAALGASIMATIYYIIFGTLAWGFAIGIQILVARRLGENRLERIGVVFQHGVGLVAVLAVTLLLLLKYTTTPILSQVISSPNVLANALEYMDYRYAGILFVCFNYLFRYFYIGLSFTKVITYTTAIMAVTNVVLNYGLIFGKLGLPEMGMGGAALASVISEAAATVFFVVYTLTQLPLGKYEMNVRHKFEAWLIKAIVKLSVPTMIQKLLAFGVWFIFFIFVEQMGEMPIAISSVLRSVSMILGITIFAYSATASTIVSRLIGQGRHDEVRSTLLKINMLSLLTLAPIVVFSLFSPSTLLSIYSDDPAVLQGSVGGLYVLCGAYVLSTVAWTYFDGISGTGNTSHALLVEIVVVSFYAISIGLFIRGFGWEVTGAWATEIVYYVVMAVISVLYMRYYPWYKKQL